MRSDNPDDDTFMAFEYLLEGREGGSTVLRFVHSGILGGDWEDEYDALSIGDRMYLEKLARYVKYFPGRTSTYNLFVPGPKVADPDKVQAAVRGALGLTGEIAEGAPVRLTVDGVAPAEGVVEFTRLPSFVGVRTDDGLFMFIRGHEDSVVVEHHSFTGDEKQAEREEQAWQSWFAKSFA
jgi:hypothetical protein